MSQDFPQFFHKYIYVYVYVLCDHSSCLLPSNWPVRFLTGQQGVPAQEENLLATTSLSWFYQPS